MAARQRLHDRRKLLQLGLQDEEAARRAARADLQQQRVEVGVDRQHVDGRAAEHQRDRHHAGQRARAEPIEVRLEQAGVGRLVGRAGDDDQVGRLRQLDGGVGGLAGEGEQLAHQLRKLDDLPLDLAARVLRQLRQAVRDGVGGQPRPRADARVADDGGDPERRGRRAHRVPPAATSARGSGASAPEAARRSRRATSAWTSGRSCSPHSITSFSGSKPRIRSVVAPAS